MLFLIEYDRVRGQLISLQSFDGDNSKKAQQTRLALEIELNQKSVGHEVVLLEAGDENALRRTHRRYFENLRELADTSALP